MKMVETSMGMEEKWEWKWEKSVNEGEDGKREEGSKVVEVESRWEREGEGKREVYSTRLDWTR